MSDKIMCRKLAVLHRTGPTVHRPILRGDGV